jgi:hypothetical protein
MIRCRGSSFAKVRSIDCSAVASLAITPNSMLPASMDFAGLAIADAVRDVAAALHGGATSPRANDVTAV